MENKENNTHNELRLASKAYRVKRPNRHTGIFLEPADAVAFPESCVGKPKRYRKAQRKLYKYMYHGLDETDFVISIRYDTEIKVFTYQRRISSVFPVFSLNEIQRKKYKKELFKDHVFLRLLKSQLNFHFI